MFEFISRPPRETRSFCVYKSSHLNKATDLLSKGTTSVSSLESNWKANHKNQMACWTASISVIIPSVFTEWSNGRNENPNSYIFSEVLAALYDVTNLPNISSLPYVKKWVLDGRPNHVAQGRGIVWNSISAWTIVDDLSNSASDWLQTKTVSRSPGQHYFKYNFEIKWITALLTCPISKTT